MQYSLNMGGWNSVFAVPTSLIDQHLKLCGENELKLLLWALRHGGRTFDYKDITAETGIPEKAVDDCLEYWIQVGLLAENTGTFSPKMTAAVAVVTSPPPQVAPLPVLQGVVEKKMLRPDGVYIARRMQECPSLAHVLYEAESMFGKTLSPSLSAVLINAHDDYCLPPEVLIMLISYVAVTGKTSTAYIEAMTKNWAEGGVATMADAERKLQELNEKTLAWKKVLSATGIPNRTASKKEEDLAYRWVYELKLCSALLAEGYERCVDNTGKFSMKYMSKIFENWNKLGLTTPDAVREHENKFKAQKEASTVSTFNVSDFDKLNVFDILLEDTKHDV